MWIFGFLPDSAIEFMINALLIVGGLSTVISLVFLSPLLRAMPGMAGYHRLIQVVSISILGIGIYLKGGYQTEQTWKKRVALVEEKLRIAEAKSEVVNVIVQEKIVNKDRIIKERGEEIIKYLDREVIRIKEVEKFIEVCPIPVDIIRLHNSATVAPVEEVKK